MIKNVGVIGCGPWGLAVARILANNGNHVVVWSHCQEIADDINSTHKMPRFNDVSLPDCLEATTDLEMCVKKANYLVIGVASPFINIAEKIKSYYQGVPIVTLTKGLLENSQTLFISDYLKSVFGDIPLAVLSGPNLAAEIMCDLPAATVIASKDIKVAKAFQGLVSNDHFRAYSIEDVRGVELGGVLKNVIAIAAGIVDGLGLGANTKSSLMTRGLREIIRFGKAYGANIETFYGLSGIGDLITTCSSSKSRNWNVGNMIAKGKTLADILEELSAVAEGVRVSRIVNELALKEGIDMPITAEVYKVLYEQKDPKKAIKDLMTRELKPE